MRVRFWGTRGSLPVSLTSEDVQRKLAAVIEWARRHPDDDVPSLLARARADLGFAATSTYGGHSACAELDTGEGAFAVCDLGSGARALGVSLEERAAAGGRPRVVNVFMSHLHWDHIMGLPFFGPAYDPRWTVRIHGGHAQLEAALRRQQDEPSFPVPFEALGARFEFVVLDPEHPHAVDGFQVRLRRQRHAGDSYGWRFARGGRSVVYSTDSEHRLEEGAEVEGFVEFFRGADLVVFDAMYSLLEAISVKEDWGHSSNVVGVELCQRAGVRHLCLFHHEPAYSDEQIEQVLRETVRFEELTREGRAPLKVSAAADGQEIEP
jgi:phosphoribosyl 1,2-cyclic phosphodiesterase